MSSLPGDVDALEREHHIDTLRSILVVHSRVRCREMSDQVVERFLRLVRIAERARQVVAAVGADEVVDVDAVDDARVHDVPALQQLPQAQIELRATDGREDRRLRRGS